MDFRLEVLATREREHVLRQSGAARSGLHRSSKPSRQASVVRDPTARHVKVGHHDHEQIVEIMRDPARELSKAFELLHLCDLRQCRFTLPRPGLDPLLQLRIRRRKLSRTSFDSPLQLLVERFELPGFPVQVAENANLYAQELRDDRDWQVVDSAGLVASQAVELRQVNCGHEDDRGLGKPWMLPNHSRKLESVELRHRNVDENDSDLVTQQLLEGLASRSGLDKVFSEFSEDDFVTEKLRRLIVDEKNIHRIPIAIHLAHGASAMEPDAKSRKQLIRIDRLRQIVRGANLEAPLAVAFHRFCGERNDRQPLHRRIGANRLHGLVAVHFRHHDVHEDNRNLPIGLENRNRFAACRR